MSFFKIPIEKLLQKLPEKYKSADGKPITFNISQKKMIEGLEDKRFWVHISARRTGKSWAASVLALAKLLEPNMNVTVVAPNFTLSSIIWDYVTEMISSMQIETSKFNAKDRVVVLINGSVFRLLSANNRDSLVGRGANLLIIDEAAIIEDDEYFTRDLRPALSTFKDSRALFISTPRGRANYLYEYFSRGQEQSLNQYPEWGSALFDWTANPLLSAKDINEAKGTLAPSVFEQEYFCKWTTFEGQIYEFDEEEQLLDLSFIDSDDPRYEFIAGLDMGYRDETAFVVLAHDGENYFIVDEYIAKEGTTSAHAEEMKILIDEWGIESIYMDSAAQQQKADLAYDYDIYCENAHKSVLDGIAAVQVLSINRQLIFDMNRALRTYNSLAAYRWNPRTEKQKPLHDVNSHCSDAVRYAIYSHQKNTVNIYVENY